MQYACLSESLERLVATQNDYNEYVDIMKKALRGKRVDVESYQLECANEDDLDVDTFLVINRQPEYLKESTLTYLKEQSMEPLVSRLNLHEWQNYTDQILYAPKERAKSKKHHKVPGRSQWRSSPGSSTVKSAFHFIWPIERSKFWISSLYGKRKKPNGTWGFHYGVDMAAQRGTPVYAADGGVVVQAQYVSGYGNTVVIQHDSRFKTRYAHLDKIFVRKNQKVSKKQKVGAVGDTGFTIKSGRDASHLHLEFYENGKHVNPMNFLPSG